jgi:uncharacterized protein (DUF934 family)
MNKVIRLREGQPVIEFDDPALRIVPLAHWQAGEGLLLGPDDDVESLQLAFSDVAMIAIDFPSFRDGRGYSQAYLLRQRLGWQGELRAVGDVLRDQLSHMRQCGFDSFAVREDKSAEDALKGLAGMSVLYGRSAIEPRPLFRRR